MDICRKRGIKKINEERHRRMRRGVRIFFIGRGDAEYKRIKNIAEEQIKEGLKNSESIRILNSINQKKSFIKSDPF